MQRQQEMRVHIDGMIHYSKAVDTAPFATDNSKLKEEEQGRHSEAEATLKVFLMSACTTYLTYRDECVYIQ